MAAQAEQVHIDQCALPQQSATMGLILCAGDPGRMAVIVKSRERWSSPSAMPHRSLRVERCSLRVQSGPAVCADVEALHDGSVMERFVAASSLLLVEALCAVWLQSMATAGSACECVVLARRHGSLLKSTRTRTRTDTHARARTHMHTHAHANVLPFMHASVCPLRYNTPDRAPFRDH